ncbi:MAG TPA: LytTR family DNA-binding domain-containing protein [Pyrinomonadaceae bacterium]|jgi:two-component system, LytTR family, response regulator|nr:LytTR family DNA-binding domain-containing protein [Pyrinomonadaceae bacterium]
MPAKIRTLIVDDEPLARRNLRLLLEKDPQIEVLEECRNGREAVKAINSLSPELIFLDIQMPEMDGFDVLQRVGPERIHAIIFVTAFDQYALKAFDVHALDYLLKPFDDERFANALARAKSQIQAQEINRLSSSLLALLEERESERKDAQVGKSYLTRLMIKASGRVFLLKVGDIDYIEADGNYAKLHVGRKAHLLREKMHDLEGRLDPEKFVRIHRSIIVNLDRIKEMHPHFNGDYVVVLEDGRQLRLSRSRREHLERLISRG